MFFLVRPTDFFSKIDVLSIWDYESADYKQVWKGGNPAFYFVLFKCVKQGAQ